MPNLLNPLCGLPSLGPASCVAFMSSVSISVMMGREVGLTCMVLVKPGPGKHEIKGEASVCYFKICNSISFIICLRRSMISNQGLFEIAAVSVQSNSMGVTVEQKGCLNGNAAFAEFISG